MGASNHPARHANRQRRASTVVRKLPRKLVPRTGPEWGLANGDARIRPAFASPARQPKPGSSWYSSFPSPPRPAQSRPMPNGPLTVHPQQPRTRARLRLGEFGQRWDRQVCTGVNQSEKSGGNHEMLERHERKSSRGIGSYYQPGEITRSRTTTIQPFVFRPFVSFVVHHARRFQVQPMTEANDAEVAPVLPGFPRFRNSPARALSFALRASPL